MNRSKNPIVKPPSQKKDPRRDRQAKDAAQAAVEALNRKLSPTGTSKIPSFVFFAHLFSFRQRQEEQ